MKPAAGYRPLAYSPRKLSKRPAPSQYSWPFTAPSGHKYGYFDGLQPDGCFHYTGEGQIGDQQLKQGNRALAEHAQMNKSVRLFSGASGEVTYLGEFQVDPEKPYYTTDAPAFGV